MDSRTRQRYTSMAIAAQDGHWPPHLLAADEDRLQAVGTALAKAIDELGEVVECDICGYCDEHGELDPDDKEDE